MHSPTVKTPEPIEGNPPSDTSSTSLVSSVDAAEQTSISLTSSPIFARTTVDTPFKPNTLRSKVLQDIVQHISINDTPERHLRSNQTPHRSATLLTPPSSEERPPTQSLPEDKLAVSNAMEPSVKVSLTEKIMAQSALYSQAIQKQQQQHPTSSNANCNSSVANPHPRPSTQRGPLSTFTFHCLQQKQQQFLTRNSVTDEHENPHDEEHDKLTAPSDLSIALTAVELPVIAEEPNQHNDERKLKTRDVERSRPAVPIPKPDPLDNPLNTTNVYINGLPLRWTDDDLYRLTRGFGAVKSVKMFTRHLEDKPSAYGFVLFNCVEDAERFILTIRQHTQFHPSFAKTMKVPGTTNAKHAISDPIIPVSHNESYADISITGLPLTIDMKTFRTLFLPHAIKASKFFHTTGTPRRLVGFVRLEGKQAAEDIVERLHGSTILGWSEKLTVQLIGSGNSTALRPPSLIPSNVPFQVDLSPPKLAGPLPEAQTDHRMPKPALGVYQHHNVQLEDFSRLVDSLKTMPTMGNEQREAGTSQAPRFNKDQGFGDANQMVQRQVGSGTSYSHLVNTLRSSILSSSMDATLRVTPDTGEMDTGPGIDTDVHKFAPGLITSSTFSTSQPLPLQNTSQLQEPQLQLPYTTPEQALRLLQAAVLVQDHFMGSMNTTSSFEASLPPMGPKPSSDRQWAGSEDGTTAPHLNKNPMQRLSGAQTTVNPMSSVASKDQSFNKPSHNRIYRPGLKIPPPILPGLDFGRSGGGLMDSGNGTSGQVPTLLPALSPSSPLLSSEEPSPVTPHFQHMSRGFDTEEEVNQA